MNELTAIDLFCGAGGLSIGLKRAGWKVVGAVEWEPNAAATHHLNFPDCKLHTGDVRDVDWSLFEGVDLVAGGPPCQPFSVSGKQKGADDERDMVPEFINAVKKLSPKAFMMENVAGLTTSRFQEYLKSTIEQMKSLGYHVEYKVLDSADFGVPQRRQRLFIVGLKDQKFIFPNPTHGTKQAKPWITVREALEGLDKGEPNKAIVTFAKNPVLRKSPYAGMLTNGKGRPLNLDAPSLTIPATAGGNRTHIIDEQGHLLQYHKELSNGGRSKTGLVPGCRRLTISESAALQDFPNGYKFLGPRSKQYSQIGNAVPPSLAFSVALEIRKVISGIEMMHTDSEIK